jgi:non-canonical (house-cleaning) NTP pyrophosphatase
MGDQDSSLSNTNSKKTVLKVAVGSSNPCKVDAVQQALARVLVDQPDVTFHLEGFPVESGVEDQPFGDEETRQGAQNRAVQAYHEYKSKYNDYPHLAIGLEGGLEWCSTVLSNQQEETLWCMAWMAVYGKRRQFLVELLASPEAKTYQEKQQPIFGLAKTATFLLPYGIAKLVKEGKELGHADDLLFNRTNSKQGSGTVGVLTNGIIPRSGYYEHALILALAPWIRPDVYGTPMSSHYCTVS